MNKNCALCGLGPEALVHNATANGHRYSTTAPTIPPCPAWCDQGEGHPYDSEYDSGAVMRTHSLDFGGPDTGASIIATAQALSESLPETVELEGIALWVGGEPAAEGLDAARARALAEVLHSSLHAAAERLAQIEGDAR